MAAARDQAKNQKAKKKYEVLRKTQIDSEFKAGETYNQNLVRALNHCNAAFELEEFKKFAIKYIKDSGHYTKGIERGDDIEYRTIGILAKIHTDMFLLSDTDLIKLDTRIETLAKKYCHPKKEAISTAIVPTLSIQEKIRIKAGQIGEDLDYYVDSLFKGSKETFDIAGFIAKHSINPAVAKHLIDQLLPIVGDLHADDAADIHVQSKRELNFIAKQLDGIINELMKDSAAKKAMGKVRAPRAKKQKPPAELIKSLKYLKEFSGLNLKSIAPTEIIGSDVVLCYDTSKRKVMLFVSGSTSGLTVKNSNIQGLDIEQSVMKTLRKPEEVAKWVKLTKRPLTKTIKDIKAISRVPTGRINEHTLILGAWK